MPYADPEKQKAAKRKSYAKQYQNPEFAAAEAARKAAWLQSEEGKAKNAESSKRARRAKKASKTQKAPPSTPPSA